MAAPLLGDWPAVLAAEPEQAGGKAWTLARLAGYGFAVPAGMAIPVAHYHAWMADNGQRDALRAALALPTTGRQAALEALHQKLLTLAPGAALQAALRAQLAGAPWSGAALAVRSSSPHEDAARASFAGIHRSHLNVRGAAALCRAIVSVWASLWNPAACAYREKLGLAHEDAAMAVLIMPLVPAKASGIAFTCDPVSGRDDRLLIHANWGLGESLVGGQAAGDEIVLAEDALDDSLRLLSYTRGSKALASFPAADGGVRLLDNAAQADAPVLSERQALALGEQLSQAALALDFARPAYDCEWAWDGERFWLLQARPVTARARLSYPELQDQPVIWSRGNTRDILPAPLSPIDWAQMRRLVNSLLEEGYRLGGFGLLPGAQRGGLFNGRIYLNLSLIQWEGYAAFGVEPAAMNHLVGGHQPHIEVPSATPRQRLRRGWHTLRFALKAGGLRAKGELIAGAAVPTARAWLNQPLPSDDAGLAAELRRQIRHIRGQSGLHFMQGSGGASLSLLVDLLNRHLPGQGHALASALLAGGAPSVTARQSYELIGVARQAMADPAARAWLERRQRRADQQTGQPADPLTDKQTAQLTDRQTAQPSNRPTDIRTEQPADWRDLPADNPFRLAFAEFLSRYGHRAVYETYLRNPRWREQPGYLLDSLAGLAATDLGQLAARQRASVATASALVLPALPRWKRMLFKILLRAAKVETNGREAARSALIAYSEPMRRLVLAIGARWRGRGWLQAADDIFLLLPSEMLSVLDGHRPGAALPALIAARQAQFIGWQREEAPDVLLDGAQIVAGAASGMRAPHTGGEIAWRGVPVGSGVATGPARLLRSPEEGERLLRGDILVAPSTDPAWTPLFLRAGGLVMETGGFLSHGAIVAREFGIPAVVNLPGILDQVRDGELLEVDGRRGTVRRLARQAMQS